MSSGATFEPHTSAPGMRSNAFLIFASLRSATSSSSYSAKRISQRPTSSSRAIRSITSSGIGVSSCHHWSRLENTEPSSIAFMIWGTIRIVPSSIRTRSVSTTAGRSSSFQTRSQSGM